MNIWGNNIKLSIFGESHGKAIGITIDGIAGGLKIDWDKINFHMERRAPGRNKFSTTRKEKDRVEVLSGIYNDITTGSPITGIIINNDTKSRDYSKLRDIPRPSHADYPAHIKYNGFNDIRGGGHFSGRLTAPLVFAGSIARQILKTHNIEIFSHIYKIGKILDENIENQDLNSLRNISNKKFPTINDFSGEKMQKLIEEIRLDENSIGGVIETMAINIPIGLGEPFFNSLESSISHLAFSIPAVKGIEFGLGFDFAESLGSEVNDFYHYENNKLKIKSNNNGGILGGISNGNPIVFKVAIKPTPSIGKPQESVNISTKENEILKITGRHDPCIVPRAAVVIESILALAILNHMKSTEVNNG